MHVVSLDTPRVLHSLYAGTDYKMFTVYGGLARFDSAVTVRQVDELLESVEYKKFLSNVDTDGDCLTVFDNERELLEARRALRYEVERKHELAEVLNRIRNLVAKLQHDPKGLAAGILAELSPVTNREEAVK